MNKQERWVKSGLLGQGIDAHYDITMVTDTSHGPVIAQVLTSHVTEEARRTASRRADLICSVHDVIAERDALLVRVAELTRIVELYAPDHQVLDERVNG